MFVTIPHQQEWPVICTGKEEMDDFEDTSRDMQAQSVLWPSCACPNPHANICNFKNLRQNKSHVIVSED